MKYQLGQKIYYRGDMANHPGWFEISGIVNNKFCKGYDLKEIDGDRVFRNVYERGIMSELDKGNGSTRFVTETAYNTYREQQFKAFIKSLSTNILQQALKNKDYEPTWHLIKAELSERGLI